MIMIKAFGKMVEALTFEQAMEEADYYTAGSKGLKLELFRVAGGFELVGLSDEANVDSVYVTEEVANQMEATGKVYVDRRPPVDGV